LLEGTDESIKCNDCEQFRRFILQRLNTNNEQGVKLGLVGLDHPLLADGLRMFDMPGVDGLSRKVDEATREALNAAHAVLVVVRDRTGLASTVNLLKSLRENGANINAVINNISFEYWRQDDPNELISDCKEAIRETLSGSGFDLAAERIFVLHLPSVQELKTSDNAWVKVPEHAAEIERLRLWLSLYLDADRVTRVLSRIVYAIRLVMDKIYKDMESHIVVLENILAGPIGIQTNSRIYALRAANAAFRKSWSRILEDEAISDILVRRRFIIANQLRTATDQVQGVFNSVRRNLGPRSRWTHAMAAEAAATLQAAFDASAKGVEDCQEDAIHALMQQMRVHADSAARKLVAIAPWFRGPLDAVHVKGRWLIELNHPDINDMGFLEIFDSARTVDRILEGYQSLLSCYSAAPSGTAMSNFTSNVEITRKVFEGAFEKRIDELLQFINAPNNEVVAECQSLLQKTFEAIDEWRLALVDIQSALA
jgi:hypothetical protein